MKDVMERTARVQVREGEGWEGGLGKGGEGEGGVQGAKVMEERERDGDVDITHTGGTDFGGRGGWGNAVLIRWKR